jgi:hypothetical protein
LTCRILPIRRSVSADDAIRDVGLSRPGNAYDKHSEPATTCISFERDLGAVRRPGRLIVGQPTGGDPCLRGTVGVHDVDL